jgi:hypothetical protein
MLKRKDQAISLRCGLDRLPPLAGPFGPQELTRSLVLEALAVVKALNG